MISSSLSLYPFSVESLLSLILFILGSIFSFIIPGLVIIGKRSKLYSSVSWITLATAIGLTAWAFQGFIFGYLQLRWLTYVYILTMASLFWWNTRRNSSSISLGQIGSSFAKITSYFRKDWLAVCLASVGVTWQLVYVWSSGWLSNEGIKFWFINFHDGVMHVAFAQELVKNFPPMQPGAIGMSLTNYHYWSDLAVAEFSRIWGLSVMHLTFQYFPLLLSLLGVFSMYGLLRSLGGNRSTARWGLFFYFFAGNLGWLFMVFMHRSFGESLPVIDHGLLLFSNTPQAFAKIIFLSSVWLLHSWLYRKNYRHAMIAAVLTASLFGFKIYFGLAAAVGWIALCASIVLTQLRDTKKAVLAKVTVIAQAVLPAALALVLSLLIYLPTNKSAGGIYYVPLAWPKLLISPTNLDWSDWWLRMQVYSDAGNTKWIVLLNATLLFVAVVFIFGTRLIGLLGAIHSYKSWKNPLWSFLAVPMILLACIGLNFLQTSGEYNVFNFFIVSLVPLTLFSAWFMGEAVASSKYRVAIYILVIGLSVPRPLFDGFTYVRDVVVQRNYQRVFPSELATYEWIRHSLPVDAVVQPAVLDTWDKDTPWTPLFTNRSSYLSSVGILISHNQPILERQEYLRTLYKKNIPEDSSYRFSTVGIDYIVLPVATRRSILPHTTPGFRLVYQNDDYEVFAVLNYCQQ